MSGMNCKLASMLLIMFVISLGCNDQRGGFAAGGRVDPGKWGIEEPVKDVDQPAKFVDKEDEHEDREERLVNRNFAPEKRVASKKSDRSRDFRWGTNQTKPSEKLSSKNNSWGKDRKMPSDSMPSRSGNWGSDRKKPSDSMPSKSKSWGQDRKMPSDSMPSKSFRSPLPSERD